MATTKDEIEFYQDKRGEWRWRSKDEAGAIIGSACEGYKAKTDCEANAKRGRNAKDKWEFYEDKSGNWRWRRMASNGKIRRRGADGLQVPRCGRGQRQPAGLRRLIDPAAPGVAVAITGLNGAGRTIMPRAPTLRRSSSRRAAPP